MKAATFIWYVLRSVHVPIKGAHRSTMLEVSKLPLGFT